jgi:hypothetical protein
MTAQDERAKVVAWLRGDAAKMRQEMSRLHSRKKLTPLMTVQWEDLIQLKVGIADAIERGDHLKEKTE